VTGNFTTFQDILTTETLTPPAHRYRLGANWEGLDPATKGRKIFIERDGIYKVELFVKYTIESRVDETGFNEEDYGETLDNTGANVAAGGTTDANGNHDHSGAVGFDGTHTHDYDFLLHEHIYRDMSKIGIANAPIEVHVYTGETLVKENHRPSFLYTYAPNSARPSAGGTQSFTRHGYSVGEISSGGEFYFTIDYTEGFPLGGDLHTRLAITGGYIRVERLRTGKEMV